jgi:cyclase
MRLKFLTILLYATSVLAFAATMAAQDLGPGFQKLQDGIYAESTDPVHSNCGIVVTSEGVVLIDSGFYPSDGVAVRNAVKKLTSQPIRFLINTETHSDHTANDFMFSPSATIIAGEGAGETIIKENDPDYDKRTLKQFPDMRDALQGYKIVLPHIEYHDKMTLTLGGRTFVLMAFKNVHSGPDTAIWLPKERALFSGAAVVPNRINNLRPFVSIPAMLNASKVMKALNPDIVVPAHGKVGTSKMFDESDRYYSLLLERVGKMMREGKSLDQIKQDLKMPETDNWDLKDRLPNNIEGAYRAIKDGYSPGAAN